MIEIKNLNKYYKSGKENYHALRNINLKLPDKGLVFIVGKSGSGKSTLLNIIGGIDSYDSGELWIDDINTADFKASNYNTYRNTYIGFIFQEFNVIKSLTVYDNIALSLELHHMNIKQNHDKIMNIINQVGLNGKEKRHMNEISGGERQRVAIARALIKNPKVIIADEPTGNLDTKNRDIVMNILKQLSKDRLVLIVTHDKEIAETHGDRSITIKDGSIINDTISNEQNLIYDTKKYETQQVSPNIFTSFKLGLKEFFRHKIRFIFIILLFSFSLIFAGSTVNLYLTNSSLQYAEYQAEYSNYILNIENEYTNYDYTTSSGYNKFEIAELKEKYETNENQQGVEFFKSMYFTIPYIDDLTNADNTYRPYTERITLLNDKQLSEVKMIEFSSSYTSEFGSTAEEIWNNKNFNVTSKLRYSIYITDYIADCLITYRYFGSEVRTREDLITKEIKIDQFKSPIYIRNIIDTDYETILYTDESIRAVTLDKKELAAFQDNLAFYNSIFVDKNAYNTILSSNNLLYSNEDIIFNCLNKIGKYDNIKIMPFNSEEHKIAPTLDHNGNIIYDINNKPVPLGAEPKKPLPQKAPQMAISRGFLEKVLNSNINEIKFDFKSDNNNYLMLNLYGNVVNFFVCGVERVPTNLSFLVTCIVDEDEPIIYTAAGNVTDSYDNYITSSYTKSSDGDDSGFPLLKIDTSKDAISHNAELYNQMIEDGIIISNVSFKKLLIVSDFIDNNLILFLGLFLAFCLFSILIIFNFVIINIKNSTKDIGIYLSLGMNGWKVSLIYLFQVLLISVISITISLAGTAIFLNILDANFSAQAYIDFEVIKFTGLGVISIIGLAILTPLLAVIFPLIGLSRKKPIDIIKVS